MSMGRRRTRGWYVGHKKHIGYQLTNLTNLASNVFSEAQRLTRMHDNATPVEVDVSDQAKVGSLIEQADAVIRFAISNPFRTLMSEGSRSLSACYLYRSTLGSQNSVSSTASIWLRLPTYRLL